MNSIAMSRDHVGRFSAKSLLTRFAIWTAKLPFVLAYKLVLALHFTLSHVLPTRRIALRVVFYQLFLSGWLLTGFFASQVYNVKCAEGGFFTTKQKCGELAEARFDAMEAARVASLADTSPAESANCVNNPDLCY